MNIFDIFIAHVTWGNDGKKRPVLILEQNSVDVTVFNITTQYDGKSETIRSKYYKINDWRQAGLAKQSYIDTNNTVTLPLSSVDINNPVGKLTKSDVKKFIEFL